MENFIQTIHGIIGLLRKYGLNFTMKWGLDRLGLGVYSTVRYPIDGIEVKTRPNTFWESFKKGLCEIDCFKFISNIVTNGQVILDIGAWIGVYTLLFSKLMNGTGLVYAFDPDPRAFRILKDNINRNRMTNVHLEQLCLSDSIGQATLTAVRLGKSCTSLLRLAQETDFRETVVNTTTIDEYCRNNDIAPDGIKIDVEGAEGLVIDGCQNTIRDYAPWILLEFHGMFMPEAERHHSWHKIVDASQKVTFIRGDSKLYRFGDEVHTLPDCPYFHVFIEY